MPDLMALEMDVDGRDAGNTGNTEGLFRVIVLVEEDIGMSTNMQHTNSSQYTKK